MKRPVRQLLIMILALGLLRSPGLPQTTAAEGKQLPEILERIGDRVLFYHDGLTNIICTEVVRQQDLNSLMAPEGRPREWVYEFKIIRQPGESGTTIRELREVKLVDGKPPEKNHRPKCTDPESASSSPLRFLLPKERADYSFSFAGKEDWQGMPALIIAFAPAKPDPPKAEWKGGCFRVSAQKKGRIWVNPKTYDVLQVEMQLADPVEFKSPRVSRSGIFWKLGASRKLVLKKSDTTIRFRQVVFSDPDQVLLLPESRESVTVIEGARTPRFRTLTSFSNYRRFVGEIKLR
jgi:hypothetical protein